MKTVHIVVTGLGALAFGTVGAAFDRGWVPVLVGALIGGALGLIVSLLDGRPEAKE